jgi:hypothetical protein
MADSIGNGTSCAVPAPEIEIENFRISIFLQKAMADSILFARDPVWSQTTRSGFR